MSGITMKIQQVADNSPSVTTFAETTMDEKQHLEFAAAVADNTHLKNVNLAHSFMTNAVALVLAESLSTNSSITHLDIGYNKITSTGCEALGRAFAVNSSLIEVKMHRQDADMGAAAELKLVEMWETNTTITRLYVTLHDRLANTTNTRGEVRNKTIAARKAAGKDWLDLDPARREEYAAQQEAERKAKAEAEAKANAPITEKVASTGGLYSYKQLTCLIALRPDDVDARNRHLSLIDAEFEEKFKMDKEAFGKLPKWKQNRARKSINLH